MRIKTGEELLHDLPKIIMALFVLAFVSNVAAALWTFSSNERWLFSPWENENPIGGAFPLLRAQYRLIERRRQKWMG